MARPGGRALNLALFLNAGLLAVIAVALLGRSSGRNPFESMALAQQVPQPIAGGAGFFLMPAQFSTNQWGCYVMDVDAQTLTAYVYTPRDSRSGELRLAAARSFVFDRQLKNYNTSPRPEEIRQLVELEKDQSRRPDDATTRPVIPE